MNFILGSDYRALKVVQIVLILLGSILVIRGFLSFGYIGGRDLGVLALGYPVLAIAVLSTALPGQVRLSIGILCVLLILSTLFGSVYSSHSAGTMLIVRLAMAGAAIALAVLNRALVPAALLAVAAWVLGNG